MRSERRPWSKRDHAKVSILQIFRAAFEDHDARTRRTAAEDGTLPVSPVWKERRQGVSEDALQAHLMNDLSSLLNTIRLEAAEPLDAYPHVQRSIVNFGVIDLSMVTAKELDTPAFAQSVRQSLAAHEPRLNPASIQVRVVDQGGDKHQRLAIAVSAELIADPVDIPIDFEAEVDLGAGRLRVSGLRVQS